LKEPFSLKTAGSCNPGGPFDGKWVRKWGVSEDEMTRAALSYSQWSGPERADMTESLLKVLAALDLTTLSGDDSAARVKRLCGAARSPLPRRLISRMGLSGASPRVAAVCVFPVFVPGALAALQGTGVKVATVAAGFPHGLSGLAERVREVEAARKVGAHEVDVVIRREWVLAGKWEDLYSEIGALREAAGDAHLKVILSTGDLANMNQVARAALTALLAGADFVKTSTGKEKVNATLGAGIVMARTLRAYQRESGWWGGLKPAGGIQTAMDGLRWLHLVEEELGPEASGPDRFRIGASSLLGNVLEALELAVRGPRS
jgi:deoxyribose-phosphate aldolase